MTMDKKDKYADLNLSASGNTTGNTKNGNTKSSAQVESLVLPPPAVVPNSCGLKPGNTIGVTISSGKRI